MDKASPSEKHEESLSDAELDALLHSLENKSVAVEDTQVKPTPTYFVPVEKPKDLSPFQGPPSPAIPPKRSRKGLIFGFLFLIGLFATCFGLYFSLREVHQELEAKACIHLADLAMANLANSVLNSPHQTEGLDAVSTKNFSLILSHPSPDTEGVVYNSCQAKSGELFLIADCRHAGFFSQFFSTHLFAISLSQYEMLELSFDETSSTKDAFNIDLALQTAKSITLEDMGALEGGEDFLPPADLLTFSSKAPLFIYNAPRYYLYGEKVLEKIIHNEIPSLLPHEVLYSSQEQEIQDFLHNATISQKKEIDKTGKEEVIGPVFIGNVTLSSDQSIQSASLYKGAFFLIKTPIEQPEEPKPQEMSALEKELSALVLERQKALDPWKEKIESLFAQHLTDPALDIEKESAIAIEGYQAIEAKERDKITVFLDTLFTRYVGQNSQGNGPNLEEMEAFFSLVQQYQLQNFVSPELQKKGQDAHLAALSDFAFLEALKNTENLQDLFSLINARVNKQTDLIDSDFEKDFSALVIDRLVEILLDTPVEKQVVSSQDRHLLESILQKAKIEDPSVVAYFLEEFDNLSQTR